ncbi:hypothetical protein DXG01_011097 [Tephrocybe rancida]|nr:hypothetical protein DXG01_011097 [Tephrocybe rancida]
MLSRLLHVEPGVFRKIALFTVFDSDFPTPLRDFLNLSLVCHASHEILTKNSAPLYCDIFAATFDILGPMSRLGTDAVSAHAQAELKRRFTALKVLRRGDLDDPNLTEAFWIAYVMFEDSDKGHKNVKHLLATGIHGLLNNFLRRRLYRGSETNNGWPIPNEQNSLAVALLWLSSSLRSLNRESTEQHEEVARLLQPFVFAAFRYPIFSTAEFCFDIDAYAHQPTASSAHGPYPPPPLLPRPVVYFGSIPRTMRVPLISLFATLSFFARREINPPAIPPHLDPKNGNGISSTRTGPTLDDIKHFHEHCQTHFADFPGIDVGVIRGRVDAPLTLSTSPTLVEPSPYKLGVLTGNWQGSFIVPYVTIYESWLTTLAVPPEFVTPGRSPLYVSLQEHYVCESSAMIPPGDATEGIKNTWLPVGFKWTQRQVGSKGSLMVLNLQHGRLSSASVKCARHFGGFPGLASTKSTEPVIGNSIGCKSQLDSLYLTLDLLPTMTVPSTLDTVPPEVLEHIAFLSATDNLLGPPSGLIPLLLISRSIYSRLSIHLNHHLYARIYAFKFDVKPIIRRLGPESTTAYILSKELPRRFQHLKRIRGHLHCLVQDGDADDDPMLTDMILSAYSLMLENEGMNEKQLRDYAKIDSWLKDYWFHEHGASRVPHYLRVEDWLPENHSRSMAMWLLWFLFNEKDYTKDDAESWNALNILKTFALGAHKYELTYPEWYYFVPRRSFPRPEGMEYLSSLRRLAAPPLATPAILSYLTLANKLAGGADNKIPLAPSPPSSRPQHKLEWEREWHRCVNLGQGDYSSNILTESFLPGSVDGVWEGLFTVRIMVYMWSDSSRPDKMHSIQSSPLMRQF